MSEHYQVMTGFGYQFGVDEDCLKSAMEEAKSQYGYEYDYEDLESREAFLYGGEIAKIPDESKPLTYVKVNFYCQIIRDEHGCPQYMLTLSKYGEKCLANNLIEENTIREAMDKWFLKSEMCYPISDFGALTIKNYIS